MEGIAAEQKYKNRAAIYLIRWSDQFSTAVWNALRNLLDDKTAGSDAAGMSYIFKAMVLRRASDNSFAEIRTKFKVTEQQLWALMIDRIAPGSASVDDMSDADAQISRLLAMQDSRDNQIIHSALQAYSTAKAETTKRNSERAKKPRNVIETCNGLVNVNDLYKKLATDIHYELLSAKELWTVFIRMLEKLSADPTETPLPDGRMEVTYHVQRGTRSIIDSSFESKLSRIRKAQKGLKTKS